MQRVTVFCGSSMGGRDAYREAAETVGRLLAEAGIGVVYGGAQIGLMGVVADSALAHGGEVIGVIPGTLERKEIAHPRLTTFHSVASMHERKSLMAKLGDGFLALPGGIGTLDEWCEIYSWATLGIHRKPLGMLNVEGYFDPLLQMLDRAVADGFLRPAYRDFSLEDDDPARLLDRMANHTPPAVPSWLNWEQT